MPETATQKRLAELERDIADHLEADRIEMRRRASEAHQLTATQREEEESARRAGIEHLKTLVEEKDKLKRELGLS
jgi:hypothetical protein